VRRPRNLLLSALTLIVVLGFILGLRRLFALRFETGDLYADYSTLNTGPRGTRALYQSLGDLGTPAVERNFLPLLRFKGRAGTTLLFVGAGRAFFGDDTEENFETFESFLREGLHVVVALNPRSIPSFVAGDDPTTDPWRDFPGRKSIVESDPDEDNMANAGERWGFSFQRAVIAAKEPKDGFEVESASSPNAPPRLPRWFSPWRWAQFGSEWKTLATVAGQPVLMRRAFGQGSLTMATDATFLSNEALWRAPEPGFLLWFLGSQPHLVFDETLHGTQSDPGIMHLLRRYRLLGFFGSVGVLLALFVWRASSSLMPAHESIASVQAGPIIGAEGATGFTNLLRQSIPLKSLLRTCFNEWARSPFVRRRYSGETVAAVRDAVVAGESAGRKHCLENYRAICRLLTRSRGS
jgi:hypothetical protein